MTLKEILKFIFILTCVITIAQIIGVSATHAYWYAISGTRYYIPVDSLYNYPLTGFIAALPTLIFINSDRTTKISWRIRLVTHFFLTLILTVLSYPSNWYGWYGWRYLFELTRKGYFNVLFIVFLLVYVTGIYVFRHEQKKLSEKLNEQIRSFQEYGE